VNASQRQWEALKWLAAILMVLDHVNSFLLGGRWAWAHDLGRAVFPIYAWIVAAGFARGTFARSVRSMFQMVCLGVCLTPLIWWLRGDHALNVLVLFACCGWLVLCWDGGRVLAMLPALVVANYCEFGLPGLAVVLCGVFAWRSGAASGFLLYVAAVGLLELVNGSAWALLGAALVGVARWLPVSVRRVRGVFFGFYAGHLALLGLVKAVL
jgi:hypothetical protein